MNFTWSLSPDGGDDPLAIRGPSRVFFELTVVPDSAPTLVLPSMLTVEGNTAGGATVSYAVSASDVEDDPDPIPTCAPAAASSSPSALPRSPAASRTRQAMSSGTFVVSVVDTTAPVLAGVPTSVDQSTTDPTGTAASYGCCRPRPMSSIQRRRSRALRRPAITSPSGRPRSSAPPRTTSTTRPARRSRSRSPLTRRRCSRHASIRRSGRPRRERIGGAQRPGQGRDLQGRGPRDERPRRPGHRGRAEAPDGFAAAARLARAIAGRSVSIPKG